MSAELKPEKTDRRGELIPLAPTPWQLVPSERANAAVGQVDVKDADGNRIIKNIPEQLGKRLMAAINRDGLAVRDAMLRELVEIDSRQPLVNVVKGNCHLAKSTALDNVMRRIRRLLEVG